MDSDSGPQRVLLKISGGTLGSANAPYDEDSIAFIAGEIAAAHATGVELAIVCGAGNIIRGAAACAQGPGRIRADYAGMLATLSNILVLRNHLEDIGVPCEHYCAFGVPRIAEVYEPARAGADMRAGKVVLLAGGTGNPLFTTDTAAALRAVELECKLLLKATRVDGVYSADPEKDPDAQRFDCLSYAEVLERKLAVMDLTAISFCMEHDLPLFVFDYAVPGNIPRAVSGRSTGTLIGSR